MSNPLITPELFGSFPLFDSLSTQELSILTPCSRLVSINRRGVLYQIGDKSEQVYFLFEGRLQGVDFTLDGREVGLFFVEPKDYCGDLGLFDRGPQSETVIATVKSMVLAVPSDELRSIIFSNPTTVARATERVAQRVRAMTAQRAILAIPDIPQRVCAQLALLTEQSTIAASDQRISNPPTHQELGIMLNTTRESVTRVFQRLQNANIVRKESSASLEILDPEALGHIAEGHSKL